MILAASLLLGLYGCDKLPFSSGEKGVATVSWMAPTHNSDGSKITDLSGYAIYYGTSSENLNESVQISDPTTTTYTVKKLKPGTTYYFSVVAFTAGGIRGAPSPTLAKTIP
jgi:hypothetical protein